MSARDTLLMLVSPSDRNRDAARLTEAGFRVISTSRMESTARQVLNASPDAIAVELVPAFADDTFAYLAQLTLASRLYGIPVLVYGSTANIADRVILDRVGATWVPVSATDRTELAGVIRNAITAAAPRSLR